MKNIKNIYIHDNGNEASRAVADKLRMLLGPHFKVAGEFGPGCDLLVCIGGDGTFLRMLRSFDFPSVPIVGIHTGHLGFFQEFLPEELPQLVDFLIKGEYSIQQHHLLTAVVTPASGEKQTFKAINDIAVKGSRSTLTHLSLSIGQSFIERFSGDGLLFSSPAGSTGYNYSIGGSIVDPRNEVLQISPIAPMNTAVFRSFTSSVMLPSTDHVHVSYDPDFGRSGVVVADGDEHMFPDIADICIKYCGDSIFLLRRQNYDFWATVKSKFF